MDLGLKGKVVLVTGGTRGIGNAIVNYLVEEGAKVAFCARTADSVNTVAKHFGNAVSGSVVDLADGIAVTNWVNNTAAHFGAIDAVIANAGAMEGGDTDEAWGKNLAIDITAFRCLTAAALPYLKTAAAENGDAAITAISSVSASMAEGPEAYGAIKAALIHYTGGLARKLGPDHVRVNTISPGTVFFDGGVWDNVEQADPAYFKQTLDLIPMGRMAQPEEIASAAVFISSPRSSYTTGSNWIIDGSISAHAQL